MQWQEAVLKQLQAHAVLLGQLVDLVQGLRAGLEEQPVEAAPSRKRK